MSLVVFGSFAIWKSLLFTLQRAFDQPSCTLPFCIFASQYDSLHGETCDYTTIKAIICFFKHHAYIPSCD